MASQKQRQIRRAKRTLEEDQNEGMAMPSIFDGIEGRLVRSCLSEFKIRGGHQDEKKPKTVSGYAARFFNRDEPGTEFELAPGMVERLHPEAFDAALEREDDVVALFNHDPNFPLGRTTAGTLELSVDAEGLFFETQPPDTQFARDLIVSMERGDINGSSFGFMIEDQRFFDEGDTQVREIRSVRLIDVSPVTYPAYAATTSEARSAFEREYTSFFAASRRQERSRRRHDFLLEGILSDVR